ncbi:MAG: hypothetical protein ACYTHM_25405, partial [Planctomycetota bacterium]
VFLLPAFPLLLLAALGCECKPDYPDLSHLSVPEAVNLHARREGAVRTLQGEVWANLESPKRSGSVRAVLLVKRPHALRMRAYRSMAGTIFDMAIRRDVIEFYNVEDETVYVQKRSDRREKKKEEKEGPDLDALFGSTGLARLILGTEAEEELVFRYMERSAAGIQLAVVSDSGLVEGYVWLDPVTLFKARQVVLGEGGRKALDLGFADYRLHEKTGLWWPRVMKIHAPREEFRMELRFDMGDLDLNGTLENDLFALDVDEGVKRVERD